MGSTFNLGGGGLASAVQALGLLPPSSGFVADGRFHRCPDTRHHRARNDCGWYIVHVHESGGASASFGSWLDGRSGRWSSRESCARLSAAGRDAMVVQRRKAEAERAARARKAEQDARRLWTAATTCGQHPYLTAKRVQSYGLRVDGTGRLLVPMVDLSGHLRSLQRIGGDGGKLYLPGTDRTTALQFTIGTVRAVKKLAVVEGYATGATIHEATGLPAVVTFDAAGMTRAAPLLRKALPGVAFIFAADNDPSGTGQRAARDAARLADGLVFMPPVTGTDWNDYANGKPGVCDPHGLDDVRFRFNRLFQAVQHAR